MGNHIEGLHNTIIAQYSITQQWPTVTKQLGWQGVHCICMALCKQNTKMVYNTLIAQIEKYYSKCLKYMVYIVGLHSMLPGRRGAGPSFINDRKCLRKFSEMSVLN